MSWSKDALQRSLGPTISTSRRFGDDGRTYGTPTWIWSVVVNGTLYVRPYNGKNSSWYKAAMRQKAGRITAAAMSEEVMFATVQGLINDRIDMAYRAEIPRQSLSGTNDRRTDSFDDGGYFSRRAQLGPQAQPSRSSRGPVRPLGQTLTVIADAGRAQRWSGPVEERGRG